MRLRPAFGTTIALVGWVWLIFLGLIELYDCLIIYQQEEFRFYERIVSVSIVVGTVLALVLALAGFLMCRAFLIVHRESFGGPEFSCWVVSNVARDGPVTGCPDANGRWRAVIREFFSEVEGLIVPPLVLIREDIIPIFIPVFVLPYSLASLLVSFFNLGTDLFGLLFILISDCMRDFRFRDKACGSARD